MSFLFSGFRRRGRAIASVLEAASSVDNRLKVTEKRIPGRSVPEEEVIEEEVTPVDYHFNMVFIDTNNLTGIHSSTFLSSLLFLPPSICLCSLCTLNKS